MANSKKKEYKIYIKAMKKIFLSSMFVVAAVAMVSCGSKQTAKQSAEEEVVTLPKIEAQTVASRMVSQEATFTGIVEAQVVNNIAPQQPLRIKEIRFDVGDHVKKGDLLVRLDNSSLVQAKAQLDNAKKEYERTNELYEFGGASKSEWDARRLQYEVAQTAYNNLVENTTLISPISGVVTARNYDKGDMYAGQPVLVIEQILAGTGIGLGSLAVNGQATTMPQAAVAANFAEPLDVHSGLTAQVTFDGVVMLDSIAEFCLLLLGQILNTGVGIDFGDGQNLRCTSGSDAINIGQSNFDPLITGKIDTRNTCHTKINAHCFHNYILTKKLLNVNKFKQF